ncbi:ribonuclease H-like domain-containing protein [Tanacetum coccineum]
MNEESVQENIINEVKRQLAKLLPKAVSDFATLVIQSMVKNALEKTPLLVAQSSSQALPSLKAAESLSEYKLKRILFEKMDKSRSYLTHDKHQVLFDALLNSILLDDDVARVQADPENFKPPPRPPTPDQEWNKRQVVVDQPEQPWFNNIVSAAKDPLTFDELMATSIDFSKCAMNRLKIDNITQAHLNNPEGDRCPFNLTKPLPLKGRPGRLTVAAKYFFNNDLEFLKLSNPEKKYTTSITKTKAACYEIVGIEDMISAKQILQAQGLLYSEYSQYGQCECQETTWLWSLGRDCGEKSLIEVIKNGNKVLKRTVGETEQEYEPTTAEEKQDRRNEMKARGTLLMALPNKDQLKFHSYKDAKLLMEAIEKRYEGNKESKKVQRTLLKQQYENFAGSSSETMDQTFDRLQKLITQLEIQGEVITQEDMNLKFNSSTNEADNTAYGVSAAHTQSSPTSEDNLSDVVIYAFLDSQPNSLKLSQNARRFIKRTGRKLDVNGQRVGFDRSKVKCYNCHKYAHFARECKAPRNQENRGREINRRKLMTVELTLKNPYQVIDKFKTGLGYNAASSTAASPAVESFVNSSEISTSFLGNFMPHKPDLTFMDEIVEIEPKTVRKNSFRPPVIEDWNYDDESEKDKTIRPSTEKIKFVKSARETVEKVETPKQNKHYPRGNQRNWNNLMTQRLGSVFKMINTACFVCGSFEHLHYVCDKKVIRPVWNNSSRVNHKKFSNKMTHPHLNRRFVPQAVLTRSGKINNAGASVNTVVRPVNTAGSKTTVNHPRPISNAYKKGYLQDTRPFNKYSANKNSIFNKKVNIARVEDTTARDRVVVSENKGKGVNVVKASACWVWKDKNSSASNTFKKYSYIDARGRSKSIMAWIPKRV